MGFHFEPAQPPLSQAVRAFWGFDEACRAGAPDERVVPDGCAEIVVHFGDPFRERVARGYREQPRAIFAGQITQPLWLQASGHADVFAVRLQPGGARRLGLPPQWMLADARVEWVDALARTFRASWQETLDRLAGARDFARRVGIMRTFLESALQPGAVNATELCIAAISASRGDCDLARVARHAGLSSRQMQRRFLDTVGITPKLFARIVRFQSAFARWDDKPASWASVAADCGYYDQPHLLRDFRQFAGEPPASFLAALAPLGSALVAAR